MNRKAIFVFASAASLVIVVGLDYLSGPQVRLGVLYAAVVGYGTWRLGPGAGWILSLLSVALMGTTEWITRIEVVPIWIDVANGLSRLAILLFVTYSFSYFRKTLLRAQAQLSILHGDLVVCGCCNRIEEEGGFWVDYPTFMRTKTAARAVFQLCPVCRQGSRN